MFNVLMTNNTYTPFHTYIESTVVVKSPVTVLLTLKCITLILLFACAVYMLYIVVPICMRRCKRRETQVDLLEFDHVCTHTDEVQL